MSIQAQESKKLVNYSSDVISPQQIGNKKPRIDALIRLISYVFYGILFGLLLTSFKLAGYTNSIESVEVNAIIGIFCLAFFSLAVIYWTFKGEIRRYLPFNYYVAHLLNATLLSVGVLVICWFPINDGSVVDPIAQLENIVTRQFILMASTVGWAICISLVILVSFLRVKKLFPLSWTKIGYSCFVLLLASTMSVFVFLAAKSKSDSKTDIATILQIGSLAVFAVAFLIFVLGISYIKVYRDILLGERTDFEVQSINNWEDIKTLSIISSSVAIMTYIIILAWSSNWDYSLLLDTIFISSLAIDGSFVVIYFLVVLLAKIKENGKNAKTSKFIQKFKSIDHAYFLELITWIILCKTIMIQGAIISIGDADVSKAINQQLYFMDVVSFGSIVLLFIIVTIFNVQVPNVKNVAISLSILLGAIFLEATALAFISEYKNIDHPVWLSMFLMLPMFIASSISLIIRTFSIVKIFKRNKKEKRSNGDGELNKEANKEENVIDDEPIESHDLDKKLDFNEDNHQDKNNENEVEQVASI